MTAPSPADPTVGLRQEPGRLAKYVLGPAEVDGTDVKKAQAVFDTQSAAGWKVTMDFTTRAPRSSPTSPASSPRSSRRRTSSRIVLDGEVVSDPVRQPVAHRRQRRDLRQLHPARPQDLANMLSYGALPLTFEESSVTTVTAALGGEQLHAGLIAGAIGLALVVIYLVAYYRGLSLIAIASPAGLRRSSPTCSWRCSARPSASR